MSGPKRVKAPGVASALDKALAAPGKLGSMFADYLLQGKYMKGKQPSRAKRVKPK